MFFMSLNSYFVVVVQCQTFYLKWLCPPEFYIFLPLKCTVTKAEPQMTTTKTDKTITCKITMKHV